MQDVMESISVMPLTNTSVNEQDSTQGIPLGDAAGMKGKGELTLQSSPGVTLGTERV